MHINHPFTISERQAILQSCFSLKRHLEEKSDLLWKLQQEKRHSEEFLTPLRDELRSKTLEYTSFFEQYKKGVPIIPLSRCPYCNSINYYSLDYYDLDGLWWWSNQGWGPGESKQCPRKQHQLCPHFLTLFGAVHLKGTIPNAPIVVLPGPEVPFIFTHILGQDSIKAVVSSIAVGGHTAYPIAYYSSVKPIKIQDPIKEWANNTAVLLQENGRVQYLFDKSLYYPSTLPKAPSFESEDFDLAAWIQKGKLYFIVPGDESLTLYQKVEICPYLNLSGRRDRLRIFNGVCYTLSKLSNKWEPWKN